MKLMNRKETGVFTAVIQSQINTQQLMLNEIEKIRTEVVEIETKVTDMYHDLKDSITLIYAEQDTLKSKVGKAAYKAAKFHLLDGGKFYPPQDSALAAQLREFVGFATRYQWRNLKEKFEVPKYIHIRRTDFEAALRFLEDLDLETFHFYALYMNWVASREALKKKRENK